MKAIAILIIFLGSMLLIACNEPPEIVSIEVVQGVTLDPNWDQDLIDYLLVKNEPGLAILVINFYTARKLHIEERLLGVVSEIIDIELKWYTKQMEKKEVVKEKKLKI